MLGWGMPPGQSFLSAPLLAPYAFSTWGGGAVGGYEHPFTIFQGWLTFCSVPQLHIRGGGVALCDFLGGFISII